MTPDPHRRVDPLAGGGAGNPARDGTHEPSRAGTCWLCGHPLTDPPEIIGEWHVTRVRAAHRHCLRVLGELDLDLPPAS